MWATVSSAQAPPQPKSLTKHFQLPPPLHTGLDRRLLFVYIHTFSAPPYAPLAICAIPLTSFEDQDGLSRLAPALIAYVFLHISLTIKVSPLSRVACLRDRHGFPVSRSVSNTARLMFKKVPNKMSIICQRRPCGTQRRVAEGCLVGIAS